MSAWFHVDWGRLFAPEMSPTEILIRGTLVYVALCLMLRFVLRRQPGRLSLPDLLVVTVVAGVCRNPLVKDAYSIPDGLLVVAVVLGWSYAMDWLSYRSRLIHRLFHAPPVVLVQDGQLIQENLQHELMTEDRLMSQLRQHGVRDVHEVAQAVIEGSGKISVVRKPAAEVPPAPPRATAPEPVANGTATSAPGSTLLPPPAAPEGEQDGLATAKDSEAADHRATSAPIGSLPDLAEQLAQQIAWHQDQLRAYKAQLARFRKALALQRMPDHPAKDPPNQQHGSRAHRGQPPSRRTRPSPGKSRARTKGRGRSKPGGHSPTAP